MLDRLALDISSSNKSGASWKTVTKGKRSKKSVAKKFNAITKIGDTSPKRVADFMVSDYDKFDGSVTGKVISNEAEHIPPKKRHTLQSSSQPQSSSRHEDESLFPQPLTPSPHGDSKLQSKGLCGSLALNFRDRVVGVNDTAFSDAVDKKLYNPNDFSGIALLAAAACIEEMDDEAGTSKVTELSVPTMTVSSEPIKCSVYMEQPNSPQGDMVNENADRKCSSLDNCAAPPQSLQENEDVAMKELEASKVDRLSWDLNVVMDSWQEPLDNCAEEAGSVNVSGHCMEDERLEEEGCKLSMKSLNDGSTANLSPVNKTEQSELVCGFDKVSRGLAFLEGSPLKLFNHQTADSDKENKFGHKSYGNLGTPAVDIRQLSPGFLDEVPTNLVPENISIVCETAREVNQMMSSKNVSICVENIGPAGLERSRYGSNTDSVVVGLPDQYGSSSSPVQPNRNDFSASSSSSHHFACTLKGQLDSISVPEEQTSFVDEHCVSKVGEELRATLPVPSRKDVGSPSDILTSGSTKIGSSLDDCQNVNVSQDNHCNTVISKDMTGFQDGNDSSYEDGELRILMPCLWEENEMDDGDSECVDYESEGSGVEFDDADYPGSEAVAAGFEGSLGIEKKDLLVRKASFSDANQSGSLKSTTETRYMKEKSDIGGIESTSRSFNNREHFVRNDNMRRRHSSGHLNGIKTTGRNYEEINTSYKRKLQSYGEGSESLDIVERTNTGYFQQSNRSCTYSRPLRDFSPAKFMGRHKSPYHERESNGGHDRWGENRGSRGQLAAGRRGPEGCHSYDRPRNWIADSSVKMRGSNSQDHRQFLHLSRTPHHLQNSRSKNVRDDYCSGNRREPVLTNRGSGSSGNYPQAVGRGFRDECYNPSHDDHPSSRAPRYLNGHEPRFSPSSGRFAQNYVPRRRSRSRSRSRSPQPLHLQGERNQVGGRRYTSSPDFRSGARVRMPFEKPSFPADYPRSFVSPPRRCFSPQQNRRWVNDHNHVENPRRGRSPVRMPKRAFRFDSGGPAGGTKEDVYSGPRMCPGRFPPPSGTRRGCNYDNYDGKRRDDRSDFIHRPRHSGPDVTASRFQHDSESYGCQDLDDAWNAEGRDVPRSSRKDVISCRV